MDKLLEKRPARLRDIVSKVISSEYFILALTIVFFGVVALFKPTMASGRTLLNIFSNIWPLFAIVIGQTFVLILAGIDLSQVSIIGLTSVVGTLMMTRSLTEVQFGKSILWNVVIDENGGPLAQSPELVAVIIAVLVMLFIGTALGMINGALISKLNIMPFMMTLVAQMFYKALAIMLTTSRNVINLPALFTDIGSTKGFGPFTFTFFIAMVLAVFAHFILSGTLRGKWLYAIGANKRASLISGVNTDGTIIFAYAFSGFCAAVGGVLYSARMNMGSPVLGSTYTMDIIGSAVIGGTSMMGGKGKIIYALIGVFFFTVLSTALSQMRLDTFTVQVIKGAVILAAAALDVLRVSIQKRSSLNIKESAAKAGETV